jgi:hypothetical protein
LATSDQLDRAWSDGYIAGSDVTRIVRPRVPPRPGPISPDVADPVRYLYDFGFKAAVQHAAGMST